MKPLYYCDRWPNPQFGFDAVEKVVVHNLLGITYPCKTLIVACFKLIDCYPQLGSEVKIEIHINSLADLIEVQDLIPKTLWEES